MSSVIKKYWIYLAVALLVALSCLVFGESESRSDSHFWRMWLSVLTGSFIVIRLLATKFISLKNELIKQIAKHIYLSILLAATIAGIFNYYQFDKKWTTGLDDYTDIAYYYLNTKYLDELGYMGFYAAMLTADKEYKNRHATRIHHYRDLRDYNIKSTKIAFEHGQEVKKNFTPQRWEQFKKDCDYFMERKTLFGLKRAFFVDHGYNPPPTWAVPGFILTSLADVEYIKIIAMVDILFVAAMFAVVAWAFGFEVMIYLALFFFCTFSGRWPVLSHSLLRFDWSATLIMGIAFMKKEHYITSGVMMGYAALTRIFPAIFFFPWLVYIVWKLLKDHRIPMEQWRFTFGAAVATIVLVASALILFGTGHMKESARNLIMHNNSYSSQRVGLGDLFVWEGETTQKEIIANGSLIVKEKKIQSLKSTFWFFGIGTMLLIALYIIRTKRPVWELIHFAAIPMFCVTNAQMNYYNLRMVLIIWHTSQMTKRPFYHGLGMVMLMTTEVLGHLYLLDKHPRYVVTTVTSICLAIYYSIMMIWMLAEIVKTFLPKESRPIKTASPAHAAG